MFDWVIVGGGPHGVCAARALVDGGSTVRIVEPSGRLMDRWSRRAEAVAMTWMRSPIFHHLDARPVSLDHFLHRPEHADVASLAGAYMRPTHAAFLRHSHDVIARYGLKSMVVPGRVSSIVPDGAGLRVEGEGVELACRRVLVATGSNARRVPAWAARLQAEGAPIEHVFDRSPAPHLDIVGGGISAVQRAIAVQRESGKTVRLWMRQPFAVADFDYDRNWTRHRFIARWAGLGEAERAAFFLRHPSRGSVPAGLATRLRKAVKRGSIEVHRCEPTVTWDADAERLTLEGPSGAVASSGLTLATGLRPEALSGWLQDVADALELPVANGVPRLDDAMHWGRGLYVSGPLARMRLGPMASNVIGARWATAKLPGVRMQQS